MQLFLSFFLSFFHSYLLSFFLSFIHTFFLSFFHLYILSFFHSSIHSFFLSFFVLFFLSFFISFFLPYFPSFLLPNCFLPFSNQILPRFFLYLVYFRPTFPFACGPRNSVGIATRYGLDGSGIESRSGARFSALVQTDPGAHPASCTICASLFSE